MIKIMKKRDRKNNKNTGTYSILKYFEMKEKTIYPNYLHGPLC